MWAFEEAGRVPARETKRPDSEREGEEKHSKGYKREMMYMYHVYQRYGCYMYFESHRETGGHIDQIIFRQSSSEMITNTNNQEEHK